MSPTTIADGTVVEIEYILRKDDGEVLDQSRPGDPLAYLHGGGNIVPGLESALTGCAVGDRRDVRVSPAEGYGERQADATRRIPRKAFPPRMTLEVQAQLVLADEEGHRFPVWIAEIGPDVVVVDLNHPLAGVPLNFSVSVVSIRAASDEELAHGHPHGPGGHHHH